MKRLFRNSKLVFFILGLVIAFGIMSFEMGRIKEETADAVAYYSTIYNYSSRPDENDGFVHSFPEGTVVRYDVDGDGLGEDITLDIYRDGDGYLTIGNSVVAINCFTPTGYFTVVDTYPYRNELLVGVSDYGPSDDFQTVFYAYDGYRITEVGYIMMSLVRISTDMQAQPATAMVPLRPKEDGMYWVPGIPSDCMM